MSQVLIVSADQTNIAKQLASIASLYPSKKIEIANLTAEHASSCNLIAVDFKAFRPKQLAFLRSFLKANPQLPKLSVLDLKNRMEVLQARELGIFNLLDRKENFVNLMVKLREILGTYSAPVFDTDYPEMTAKTVRSTCIALENLTVAALSDAPLPVSSLTNTAQDITAAMQSDGIENWLSAVQCHHSHTYCHTMMVVGHTVSFAKELGLPEEKQIQLGLGALVHDLGKVKIPLTILDKPGKLTAREREQINKHPFYSKEILKGRKEVPREVAEMAIWHHELLDGTGYPDRLKGNEIPQAVRLLTICDIYSALTEKRAYKDSFSPRQAFLTMFDMGNKLDRPLLKSFRSLTLTNDYGGIRRMAS